MMDRIPTPAIASGASDAILNVDAAIVSVELSTANHAAGSVVIPAAAPENEPAIRMIMYRVMIVTPRPTTISTAETAFPVEWKVLRVSFAILYLVILLTIHKVHVSIFKGLHNVYIL